MGILVCVIKGGCVNTFESIVEKSNKILSKIDLFNPLEKKESQFYFFQKMQRINANCQGFYHEMSNGNWLATSGTWFHNSGISSGDEKKLLEIICKNDINSVVKNIDGFFNLMFWDEIKKKLCIVTDIIGSAYCFFRIINDCIIVSNSSYFLAKLGRVTIDLESFQEFINLGIIYGKKSFFNEVKRLDFSSIIYVKNGSIESKKYWLAENIHEIECSTDEAVDKFSECLYSCIDKSEVVSSNPVIDLTSGFDSRVLVTGFINKNKKFSTNVVGNNKSKDVIISKELAEIYSISHHHVETKKTINYEHFMSLLWLTDGEMDLFEYSNIFNTHLWLSKKFNIGFNGSFGELARGYWWELLVPNVGKYQRLDSRMLSKKRFAAQVAPISLIELNRQELIDRLAAEIDHLLYPIRDTRNTFQMDCCYLFMRMRCWQGRIASATDKIWPCFSPLMLRQMIELLLALPPEIKNNDRLYKNFLAKVNPLWAKHRTESGCPAEPVMLKNAHQFWPIPFNLARKSVQKISSKLGVGLPKKHLLEDFQLRQGVFKDERFRSFLSFKRMVSANYLESGQLQNFLEQSMDSEFSYQIFWQRLLSYELLIKTVEVK